MKEEEVHDSLLEDELKEAYRKISDPEKRPVSERSRMEDAVKGSEESFRHLMQNAHDVVWIFNLKLGHAYVSPSVKRLRGYTVEEAMQQNLKQVLTPDSYDKMKEIVKKEILLELNGQWHSPDWTLTTDIEMTHKNGSTVWAEATINLLFDELGRVKGIMAISRDITERKQAEEELKKYREQLEGQVRERTLELLKANAQLRVEIEERRQAEKRLMETEDKYRTHFSLSDDVMFSWDNQFTVTSVSPNLERVLGYKPEEVVGKSFDEIDIINPEDKIAALENAMHLLSGKQVHSSVYRFITKDGKIKFGDLSEVPITREGQITGMVSVGRDITRYIELKNSLQESEERYRMTLQSMPDAVIIMRMEDAQYLYVNEAFTKITGYMLQEAKGKRAFDLNIPGREIFEKCIELVKGKGSVENLGHNFRKKDGITVDVLISARPLVYDGEDCIVMVMSDVTMLKHMIQEKQKLDVQTHKMESMATLTGGIAHDFNNLLTTIIGYTKMSLKDVSEMSKGLKAPDLLRSDLEEVKNAANRAKDLVNHFLTFSRQVKKEFIPIELGTVISESLKVLRPALPANIKVRENIDGIHLILGDAAQIHQVLANLCTNSVQSLDGKGGELEVSIGKASSEDRATFSQDMQQRTYIKITFRDTGQGMTSRVMARIFDPYFTTNWKGSGKGLGLSIVHGIIKSHHGMITCKSSPGEGTVFEIFLPELDSDEGHESVQDDGEKTVLDLDRDPAPEQSTGNGPAHPVRNKHA
jgi:PAS domain S-box-containing protein